VRFVHETFCKLQPGTVLMCLHGKQKQDKRNIIFTKFTQAKSAVLFCTDIAARGLDFPSVDWVLQLDCPEDADTYIHRVGRTARYNSKGHALLFLVPSEELGMTTLLAQKRVPISKIAINPSKTQSIIPNLQSMCAQWPEMKYLAEKAFICYLRSVWLQRNKEVFDVTKMPLDAFASSLGLPGAPHVKFVRVSGLIGFSSSCGIHRFYANYYLHYMYSIIHTINTLSLIFFC
jgi:ATP-dependent RNA helicase DDX10/DBP4